MKKFSIANFNLLNFNEPHLPMYRNAKGWSQEVYDRKIRWTARQLELLDADIVGFQELWHSAAIQKAIDASALASQYKLLVPPQTEGGRIVCGAIVRTSIHVQDCNWIDNFPAELVLQSKGSDKQTPEIRIDIRGFSRPVLHARLKLHRKESLAHLFVCHFKSKGPTDVYKESWYKKETHSMHATALGAAISTIRRTAEAAALRVIITTLMKNTDDPVIVIGDINDGQGSNTQNILTEQPGYLFGDSIGGSDTALYSAQVMQEFRDTRDVLYTYSYKGMKESLDHILFSQEFYDHSRKRRWLFDGLTVANDHLNQDDHDVSGTNDHGIIKANFVYRPYA